MTPEKEAELRNQLIDLSRRLGPVEALYALSLGLVRAAKYGSPGANLGAAGIVRRAANEVSEHLEACL